MSIYTISNGILTASISSHGAELISLKSNNGQEYIWNANPDAWKRHSPVLFPLVGRYNNDFYQCNGTKYAMSQHGFARDSEFELHTDDDNEIWFVLKSNEASLKVYPFDFELYCGYRLEDNALKVMWRVNNTGREDMAFAIGAHPAFVNKNMESLTGGKILFEGCESIKYYLLDSKGLKNSKVYEAKLEDGMMSITDETFANDALVLEDSQCKRVSLIDACGEKVVTVEMETPVCGIWSPVGKHNPFVCIEPWYGRCDASDFEGDIFHREYENILHNNDVFEKAYKIICPIL